MLVFIDESGDPGFKVAKGSSPVFVAAMIVFADNDDATRAQEAIRELLKRIHHRQEFKFNQCRADIRDSFFVAMRSHRFIVRAIVVRKALIWSQRLRTDDATFYNFFVKTMVKFDNRRLTGAKVFLVGSGNREFRQALSTYLKHHAADGALDEIRFRDSKGEPLLQLADMCVGAIARSYRDDRQSPNRWRRMIESKLDDVWEFK